MTCCHGHELGLHILGIMLILKPCRPRTPPAMMPPWQHPLIPPLATTATATATVLLLQLARQSTMSATGRQPFRACTVHSANKHCKHHLGTCLSLAQELNFTDLGENDCNQTSQQGPSEEPLITVVLYREHVLFRRLAASNTSSPPLLQGPVDLEPCKTCANSSTLQI